MKKSGFTIVELIVSIALIAMLSTILTVVIVKKIKAVKDTTYGILIESIGISAEEYATNNEALLSSYAENDWVKIPLSTLIEKNYFEESLINPKTNTELPITDYVYVTRNYKGKIESFYNINQNTSPSITLNGKYNIYIKLNSPFTDPGVVALDSDGTNVTSLVTKTGTVDTNNNGAYVITYKYKSTTITRNVIVGDNKEDGTLWHNITINPSGGYFNGSNETTIYNLKEGRNQDLSDIIKAGSIFSNWNYSCTGCTIIDGIFTMGTSNATLTANWTALMTLTVNLNGGTSGQTFNSGYPAGTTILLTEPTRAGYSFTSWTASGTGATIVGTTLTIGTATTTITANWLSLLPVYTYTGSSTLIDDGSGNWRIKFLTSGTFTPSTDMIIDVFIVGGGGGGAGKSGTNGAGGGGGGGYTGTWSSISLTASTAYPIVVGGGGGGGAGKGIAGTGGTSTAFGYSKTGGLGGSNVGDYTWHANPGGAGGCGGGTSGHYDGGPQIYGGTGGSDGSAGSPGASGQGTTTREFGEAGATLYAGGGGGAAERGDGTQGPGGVIGGGRGGGSGTAATSGTVNTGGGGGGNHDAANGASGGSGIVIIRNHR